MAINGSQASYSPRPRPLHVAPGRARLQVPGLYRGNGLKRRLEARLRELGGVRYAEANVLTGNILVVFDPETHQLTDILIYIEGVLVDAGVTATDAPEMAEAEYRPATPPAGPAPARALPDPREWVRAVFGRAAPDPVQQEPTREGVWIGAAQVEEAWHALDAQEAVARLEARLDGGLNAEEAAHRLARYGQNALPAPPKRSELAIFLSQFVSIPVGLLTASAVVSVATGGLFDAVAIMGVVLINSVIGYFTESQAERTIRALTDEGQTYATVLREGKAVVLPSEQVVPGDLLVLAPGISPAADARLVTAQRLSVDESALSGESLPVSKQVNGRLPPEVALADRSNMVYRGTTVTGGSGLAVVVATGPATEIGRIQALAGEAKPPETPMERQLDQIGTQMVVLSSAICGLVFVVGLLRGHGLLQMLKSAISLAVAAVPEGLPTVATTTLSLGIRDMRAHKVAIRHLDAVETLGSVQTICFDKTGTITENRMTVVLAQAGPRDYRVAQGRFLRGDEVRTADSDLALQQMLRVGVFCNECEVEAGFDGLEVKGSPTEAALIRAAEWGGLDVPALREAHPLLLMHHRAEGRNYMSSVHPAPQGGRLLAVKGSPGEVLALCSQWIEEGEATTLGPATRQAIQEENERLAGRALRLLGFAYALLPEEVEVGEDLAALAPILGGLTWLGMIGMEDPIREGMRELIGQFHSAGIRTIMITGDQSTTAYAIGHSLDLSGSGDLEILDSAKLESLDPELLTALAQKVHVFSRVSPAHKLKIVQALQRAGLVVAMTGDGVNDGPALKAADIGVAMGERGTDTARGMADVVLQEDNLHTMITAVSKGRAIYDNIRKSLRFLLATNLTEIEIVFGLMAAGMGEPLTPMQLLWINLISDIFPGLALALEPPEPDNLQRPPRDPKEPIIAWSHFRRLGAESAVISGGALAAFGYGVARYGLGPQARTLLFSSLVGGQLLHALVCRSPTHGLFSGEKLPRNPALELALGGSLALQVAANTLPPLRSFLQLAPIGPLDALVAMGGAAAPLLINELGKVALAAPKHNPQPLELRP